MPARAFISKELAKLLSVLSHPHRIRIIEELRSREMDVNSLQTVLGVAHSGVSQHLGLLRSHRLVSERREGRHVYYHLTQPRLAQWLMAGLEFLEGNVHQAQEMREALAKTRNIWGNGPEAGDAVQDEAGFSDLGNSPLRHPNTAHNEAPASSGAIFNGLNGAQREAQVSVNRTGAANGLAPAMETASVDSNGSSNGSLRSDRSYKVG